MPSQREGFLARGFRVSWPHLVLLAAYLFYLGIGGWIFVAIEGGSQPDYTREVAEYEALKAQIDEAIRNLTEGREVTAVNLTALWEKYTSLVDEPFLEDLTNSSRVDWTFTGSVLFCATSIATIGYGDAVPVTSWGRVAIVIYSLVGIPLTLTFLADIGGLLARVVILISGKFQCSRGAKRSPRPLRKAQIQDNVRTQPLQHHNGLSTRSAEGIGHEPAEDTGNIMEVRLALGIFQDSADPVRGSQPSSRRNSLDADEHVEDPQRPVTAPSNAGIFSGKTNLGVVPDDTGRAEEIQSPHGQETGGTADAAQEEPDTMRRHVPVVAVVGILLAYTFLGALMIAYVEDWYYGEALYFTFVTLTTIGFGDFVPVKHYMDIPSFVGCLVYTIVGLSVMSMCIALVQAKVVKMMSRIAGKIGF